MGEPDVPKMSLAEACLRTLETKENVIPSVHSAHASKEGKELLRQLQKCKSHEPAGGKLKPTVNDNLLNELSCLYPEAPKELLRNAAGCSRLEDAIDMITECLAAGVATPLPKQETHQHVSAALQWPSAPAPAIEHVAMIRAAPSPSPSTMTEAADRKTVHMFKIATVSSPTWCSDCGNFLWGVSNQGFTCQWCSSTVCKPCAEKGVSKPCQATTMLL